MEGEGTLSRAQGPAGDAHQAREGSAHTGGARHRREACALTERGGRCAGEARAVSVLGVCSFSLSFAINDAYDTLDPGGQHDDSIFVYTVT